MLPNILQEFANKKRYCCEAFAEYKTHPKSVIVSTISTSKKALFAYYNNKCDLNFLDFVVASAQNMHITVTSVTGT